jgi:hypothetical protein
MSDQQPLTAVGNGRAADGKFATGNRAGKGNPNNRRAQQIRSAIIKAIKPAEMAEAARQLLKQAKGGDRQAFAELCDRIIGKPIQQDVEERIAALEKTLEEREESNDE